MDDDIFPHHSIHGASLLQRRNVLLSNSSPSFHILPAELSEGWMGALPTARSSLPFTKKKRYGATIYFCGTRVASFTSSSKPWRAEAAFPMHAKTAHIFSSGGMVDSFLFFPFLGILYIYPPSFFLLRREGYYGNEEMTETMSIRRKRGTGAGVFGGTFFLSQMEWAFLHG